MNDLISRQDAIETSLEFLVEYCGGAFDETIQKLLIEKLNALPPEQSGIDAQKLLQAVYKHRYLNEYTKAVITGIVDKLQAGEDIESCSNIEASFDWISEARNKGYTVNQIARMYRNETGKIPKDDALYFKKWVKNFLSNSNNTGDFNNTFLDDLLYQVHKNYKGDNLSDVDVVDIMIEHVNMLIENGDLTVPEDWKTKLGTFVYNNYEKYDWGGGARSSKKVSSMPFMPDRTVSVTGNNWNEFLDEVEKQTGLLVDSAYRRRYDNWIQLFDEYGNWFDAEITRYSDGTYELIGSNISYQEY